MGNILTLSLLVTLLCSVSGSAAKKSDIFSRPVISRGYEQNQWVLRDTTGSGLRENATSVGHALANLQPSYVSGLIYLQSGTEVNDDMITDWKTIRSMVHAKRPDAKFDIEMSLNTEKNAFANADALVAKMKDVNNQLSPEGWWFDFYSSAPADWIAAAIKYAHAHNQTVGGNIFNDKVPAGTDAFAFVDKAVSGSKYGFDFNRAQIAKLEAAANGAAVLGHLQSNPQNGAVDTNECYAYTQEWTEVQRLEYLRYWAGQQCSVGFTFMFPIFYPLYPGAVAWDPLTDDGANVRPLYNQIQKLMSMSDC